MAAKTFTSISPLLAAHTQLSACNSGVSFGQMASYCLGLECVSLQQEQIEDELCARSTFFTLQAVCTIALVMPSFIFSANFCLTCVGYFLLLLPVPPRILLQMLKPGTLIFPSPFIPAPGSYLQLSWWSHGSVLPSISGTTVELRLAATTGTLACWAPAFLE